MLPALYLADVATEQLAAGAAPAHVKDSKVPVESKGQGQEAGLKGEEDQGDSHTDHTDHHSSMVLGAPGSQEDLAPGQQGSSSSSQDGHERESGREWE